MLTWTPKVAKAIYPHGLQVLHLVCCRVPIRHSRSNRPTLFAHTGFATTRKQASIHSPALLSVRTHEDHAGFHTDMPSVNEC